MASPKRPKRDSVVTRIGISQAELAEVAEKSERTGIPSARLMGDAVREKVLGKVKR